MDNAGFVDNGGRTSDEFPMGELGGARATEGGGRPPAAAPTTVPLPTLGNTESSFAPGTTQPPTASPVSTANDPTQRLASATCDRETACHRIGVGQKLQSQESCVVRFSELIEQQLGRLTCANGVREDRLAACLKAVRNAPCAGGAELPATLPVCSASTLCAP